MTREEVRALLVAVTRLDQAIEAWNETEIDTTEAVALAEHASEVRHLCDDLSRAASDVIFALGSRMGKGPA